MNLENPAKLYATQHFCSMKITQAVREYAAQKEIDEQAGLGVGMKEKARVHVSQSRIKQSTLSGG